MLKLLLCNGICFRFIDCLCNPLSSGLSQWKTNENYESNYKHLKLSFSLRNLFGNCKIIVRGKLCEIVFIKMASELIK